MKMKKFASAALAGVMALSMSATAFAAGTTTDTRAEVGLDGLGEATEVEITGTTKTAEVKIKVPTSGNVVLNPYGLSYETNATTHAMSTDQIISAAQYIENQSDLPVKVTAKVTGTLEGAEFSDAAVTDTETAKKVFLQFNMEPTTVSDNEPGSYTHTKVVKKTAVDCDALTMDEKDGTNAAIAYKFTGGATKNPNTAWTTDDIVGATIAFTFTLDNSANAGGGGGGSTSTTPSVSATMTGTPAASGSVTLNAAISNIAASKNPTYSWAVTTDTNSIVDSFTDSAAAAQTVTIAAGATTGQSATLTVTVTYDDTSSQDATVTDTVTITIP